MRVLQKINSAINHIVDFDGCLDALAFILGRRDTVYFAWSDKRAHLKNGKVRVEYYHGSAIFYNFFFRKYPQIIFEKKEDDFRGVRIFIFRTEEQKQKSGLFPSDFGKKMNHEKIGRALDFPDFAIEDFSKNPKSRLKIFIKKSRMMFIVENSKSRISDLENWAKENGVAWKNIKIKELGARK